MLRESFEMWMEIIVVGFDLGLVAGALDLKEFGAEVFICEKDFNILWSGNELFENSFCLTKLSISGNWNAKILLEGRLVDFWVKEIVTSSGRTIGSETGGRRRGVGSWGGNIWFPLFIFFLFLGILVVVPVPWIMGKCTLIGLVDEFDQQFGEGIGLNLTLFIVLNCEGVVPFCRWAWSWGLHRRLLPELDGSYIRV